MKAAKPQASAGVVLAGGLGRRMGGGDKPLVAVGGRPMLRHAVERLAPQVAGLVISANGDPSRFAEYRLPVVSDPVAGFAGPLAGILAGMYWARASVPDSSALASVAADTPFFPADLVARLAEAADGRAIAVATSSGGTHPVCALWPLALADDLQGFLAGGESGKILAFVDRHPRVDVHFDDIRLPGGEAVDPFFNVNRPADVQRAEAVAAALAGPA